MNPFTPQQELRFARVAGRASRRLPRDMQSEVFATAYIKARETHGEFDPNRGEGHFDSRLDNWFYGLVLNAKKKIRRENQSLGASDALQLLISDDNPEAEAARDEVLEQLTPTDLAILNALREGASVRQAARQCGQTVNYVKHVKRTFRNQMQSSERIAPIARSEVPAPDDDMREAAPIDHAIEKLLRRPLTTKADCPICWRCSWWEPLLPHETWCTHQDTRFADPEVHRAVMHTEARKVSLATARTTRPPKPFKERLEVFLSFPEYQQPTAANAA